MTLFEVMLKGRKFDENSAKAAQQSVKLPPLAAFRHLQTFQQKEIKQKIKRPPWPRLLRLSSSLSPGPGQTIQASSVVRSESK